MVGMSKSGGAEVSVVEGTVEQEERRWFAAAMVLAVALALVVFLKMVPVAGGADASGYMNYARLLSDGALTDELRVPAGDGFEGISKSLFQPLGFSYRSESDSLSPVYPMGLPLLLSIGAVHESEFVVRLVYAVVAFLACLGLWKLAAEMGLRTPWGFYGVAVFATSPLLLWSSLILMSDALAVCQAIWVLFLALRACSSRSAAILCGVLIGWAVLTRPSNVLLFVPVIVALLWGRAGGKTWLWGVLGGLPALGIFLWSNWILYGDPLESGYGNLWSLFAWGYGPRTLAHYGTTLLYAVFILVLPSAVLGAIQGRDSRVRLLLAWAVPVFGFYAFYSFTSQTWWFLRFILVGVPALVLLSACYLEGLSRRVFSAKRERYAVITVAVLSVGAALFWEGRLNIFGEQDFERRYVEECSWANENLEPGTLVVCMQPSGSFYYYTEFPIFRWDLADLDSEWEELGRVAQGQGTEVVAILHAFEEQRGDSILMRYPERWELIGDVGQRIRAYRWR